MAENVLVLRGEGNVDVQVGGPGNDWEYLSACATMTGPTVPYGGTEIRWCQDPNKANGFKVSSQFRTAPDQISFDLVTKLGKVDFLADLNCPFGLRARYAKCGTREDPANYDPLMLAYCNVQLQEKSYEDLVVGDPANQDEILVTTPSQATSEYRIQKVVPAREGTAAELGDQIINDLSYCDQISCGGYCGDKSDGCTKVFAGTNADTTPYASPNLIKGVKNMATGVFTWTIAPILGLNGNVCNIECTGGRLFVSSNADSAVGWNANDGAQNDWNFVILGNAPSTSHNSMFMRNAHEGYIGCVNGYIYKTDNAGGTWTAVLKGTVTTQTINAIYAYDRDLVYAVGNAGVIIKSQDGGVTWEDVSEVAITGNGNLWDVIVPPERPREIYVANNKIWRSKDAGANWANVPFDGDGVGSVDDMAFCGPCAGDVLWILHNDAGPRARILRDLSGGAGGDNVEVVMDWLKIIPVGIDLNVLACCGVNTVMAGGALSGGYPVMIKVGF